MKFSTLLLALVAVQVAAVTIKKPQRTLRMMKKKSSSTNGSSSTKSFEKIWAPLAEDGFYYVLYVLGLTPAGGSNGGSNGSSSNGGKGSSSTEEADPECYIDASLFFQDSADYSTYCLTGLGGYAVAILSEDECPAVIACCPRISFDLMELVSLGCVMQDSVAECEDTGVAVIAPNGDAYCCSSGIGDAAGGCARRMLTEFEQDVVGAQ